MSLSIISFTGNGRELSKRVAEALLGHGEEGIRASLFTKYKGDREDKRVQYVSCGISDWAGAQLREHNSLLFIGACGIAVRAIAPFLTDKLHDAPVLVMDERGLHIIPILSGHVGGANELACMIGGAVGAEPVITTATDLNGRFAVDLFAKRNGLWITDRKGIARVSSRVLAGEEISVSIEPGHEEEGERMPLGLRRAPYPPGGFADIVISAREDAFDAALLLRPREYVLGIGCKRGKGLEEIGAFLREKMAEFGILPQQVYGLASIEQKKDEPGILAWCRAEGVPFFTYTAGELREVEGSFQGSSFVAQAVGVDNVCERAALRACGPGGRLVYGKHASCGMTVAIAKRDWRVHFYEE